MGGDSQVEEVGVGGVGKGGVVGGALASSWRYHR